MSATNATLEVPTISFAEFRELRRDRRVLVVDVLPPASYATAHIPGAINLPLASLPERAGRLIPDRARPIIVYCGSFT